MTNPNPREARAQPGPDRSLTAELSTRAARIYELRHRERYNLERERLAEWIDLGGEEGA